MLYSGNQKYKLFVGHNRVRPVVDIVLPYDAEIEYLKGTGTQYINTGYVPKGNDVVIKGKFLLEGYTAAYGSWFGAYTNEATNSYRIIRNNTNNTSIYYTGGTRANTSGTATVALNNTYEFELSYNKLVINGTTRTHSGAAGTANAKELVLWTNNAHNGFSKGCFYYFQVYKNGVLVLDLIPVRVGNVGYMFDRMQNQLLGNAGSGDFILGNDLN